MRIAILVVSALLISTLIGGLLLEQPQAHRNWHPDFAIGPHVSVDETIRIGMLRNYSYDPLERTYASMEIDPARAQRMWLLVEPFRDNPVFAHTFFSFDADEYVSFSIEARREAGEPYSAVQGLLRNYELLYMWGTEQDFIGRRAVELNHTVVMLPVNASPGFVSGLMLELARESERLEREPKFYHTITDSCTTELAEHANRVRPGTIPLTKHRFMPGLAPELLYDEGLIDTALAYEEMMSAYDITSFVRSHELDGTFSKDLREHLETVE